MSEPKIEFFSRHLRVALDRDQLVERGAKAAQLNANIAEFESELATASKAWKSRIADAEKQRNQVLGEVRDQACLAEVECQRIHDYEKRTVVELRGDTWQELSSRAMTHSEWTAGKQTTLPLDVEDERAPHPPTIPAPAPEAELPTPSDEDETQVDLDPLAPNDEEDPFGMIVDDPEAGLEDLDNPIPYALTDTPNSKGLGPEADKTIPYSLAEQKEIKEEYSADPLAANTKGKKKAGTTATGPERKSKATKKPSQGKRARAS